MRTWATKSFESVNRGPSTFHKINEIIFSHRENIGLGDGEPESESVLCTEGRDPVWNVISLSQTSSITALLHQ